MLSKSKLKDKYLKVKKKKKRNKKVKKAKSRIIDLQDQDYFQTLENRLDEGEAEFMEDEKPVFVETEESRKLTKKEKESALEKIYGKEIKKSKKDLKNKNTAGKWINLKNSKQEKIEKEENSDSADDSEVESTSSEEEGLDIRHDSSDSDLEEDQNELKLEKSEREKNFKEKISNALGLGGGVDIDTESEDESDLDSGSSDEEKDGLAMKLEELKEKDKVMKELAKEFKNAATAFRDKTGKKMSLDEFEAAKKKKLEKLNEAMVSFFFENLKKILILFFFNISFVNFF